jgi:uncharacterized protein (TIGR00369 family)
MRISDDSIKRQNANSLYQTVGIRLESAVDGSAVSVLDPRPNTCWPFEKQPHGGMLFTLMDTTMAWAIQSKLESGFSCTTIELGIRYIMPARGSKFCCRAQTLHQTGRLSFVQGDITDAGDQVIATGQATFRIIKMDLI